MARVDERDAEHSVVFSEVRSWVRGAPRRVPKCPCRRCLS
jgi:hypothetical protein